jgi:hypothetical protein
MEQQPLVKPVTEAGPILQTTQRPGRNSQARCTWGRDSLLEALRSRAREAVERGAPHSLPFPLSGGSVALPAEETERAVGRVAAVGKHVAVVGTEQFVPTVLAVTLELELASLR